MSSISMQFKNRKRKDLKKVTLNKDYFQIYF